MMLERVDVKNFRLLRSVSIALERRSTLVVGRNNSGKTSLTELLRRLLVDQTPVVMLEDFSLTAHEGFWAAAQLLKQGKDQDEVRRAVPIVEVGLTFSYEKQANELGALGACIIDLDPDCCKAVIDVCFAPGDGKILKLLDLPVAGSGTPDEQKRSFFRELRDRVPCDYAIKIEAVDPTDTSNRKTMELTQLRAILRANLISAQRGLDDVTTRDRDVLGKILQDLFTSANGELADPKDRIVAEQLKVAVAEIESDLQEKVSGHVTGLLPTFELFGYPGLADPRLTTETTFDVARLLQNHTKVRYSGVNGITLPENYNGLGARNLIYILLQLLSFFRAYKANVGAASVHLVFIEEPEAHLHPQMQEVFIHQIEKIADVFAKEMNGNIPWPVQFLISTHSSHMANAAPFTAMRYFMTGPDGSAPDLRETKVKNLGDGLEGQSELDRKFLYQYLTLTRCDLLFADKAVLIEGTCERLLLPRMISVIDAEDVKSPQLASQYLTVMEVGGAYAHLFFPLLEFLQLPTLIITDIDPIDATRQGCVVKDGVATSNACIKKWFAGTDVVPAPASLILADEKSRVKGFCRLAYQLPEAGGGPCGRTLEDAFILANRDLFGLKDVADGEVATRADELAKSEKKTTFALKHAIESTAWVPPRYIAEGLRWLARTVSDPRPPSPPNQELAVAPAPERAPVNDGAVAAAGGGANA